MPPANPKELTADEVALLVVAARLTDLVKAYADHPTFTEEIQFYWNQKIGKQEMVRSLWSCQSCLTNTCLDRHQ